MASIKPCSVVAANFTEQGLASCAGSQAPYQQNLPSNQIRVHSLEVRSPIHIPTSAPPTHKQTASNNNGLPQSSPKLRTGVDSAHVLPPEDSCASNSPEDQTPMRRNLPKFIILHYSPFKAVWDWVVLLLVLYTAVFIPYTAAFLMNEEKNLIRLNQHYETRATNLLTTRADPLVVIDLIVDMMFLADIVISFRTTYVHNGEVISEPPKIARNYIKGWFLLDALAAVPLDLLLFGSGGSADTVTVTGVLKTVRLLRLLRVVRRIKQYAEYGSAVLLLLMSTFALVSHWMACIWYAIAYMERDEGNSKIGWLNHLAETYGMPYDNNNSLRLSLRGPDMQSKYITALYFTLTALTSIGFGNVAPTTNNEKIFAIFAMLLGSLMSAAIFGNVSSMMLRLYQGTEEFHEKATSIREFIQFHRIPKSMAHRLMDSFQSNCQFTNGVDMSGVLKVFPECLQADICLHMNRSLLTNCYAFRGATPGCLRALSMKFRTIHVPPSDILIHPGDILDATYFITRGSLEVVQEMGENDALEEVIAILGKNDIFGLDPVMTDLDSNEQSAFRVRALSYVDLNKILFADLHEVLTSYPEWSQQFMHKFQLTFNLSGGDYHFETGDGKNDEETLKFIKLKKPRLQTMQNQESVDCSLSHSQPQLSTPMSPTTLASPTILRQTSHNSTSSVPASQTRRRLSRGLNSSCSDRLLHGRVARLRNRVVPFVSHSQLSSLQRSTPGALWQAAQKPATTWLPQNTPRSDETTLMATMPVAPEEVCKLEERVDQLSRRTAEFEERLSQTVDSMLRILGVNPGKSRVVQSLPMITPGAL